MVAVSVPAAVADITAVIRPLMGIPICICAIITISIGAGKVSYRGQEEIPAALLGTMAFAGMAALVRRAEITSFRTGREISTNVGHRGNGSKGSTGVGRL
jgi:TRAP-type C4-dicarboxylate transport system permease small subunit